VSLIGAVVVSAAAAIAAGGGMWQVHLALDASLVLFVALLLGAKRRRREKDATVRSMPASRAGRESRGAEAGAYGGRRA